MDAPECRLRLRIAVHRAARWCAPAAPFFQVPKRVFVEQVDHTLARNYGMLILGIGKGKEKSLFESEVDEQVKNSEPASVVSKG